MVNRKVLIAAGEDELASELAGLFERSGFSVSRQSDPKRQSDEGTSAPKPCAYDLCVVFWRSRDTSPVELIRQCRKANRAAVVICCTESADTLQGFLLWTADVAPSLVISGPVSCETILSEAKRLLRQRRHGGTQHLAFPVDSYAEPVDETYAREFLQLLQELSSLKTLQEALDVTVGFVSHVLHAERVSVMLCEGDQLRIRASRGLPDELVRSTSVPVGSGVAGRVFASGTPICVNHPAELGFETVVNTPYQVFAAVPLVATPLEVGGRPVGIINVTNRLNDLPLAGSEMILLCQVSHAAAITISGHLERAAREQANFAAIRSLGLAVEAKDRYTSGHSERVALRSVQIGDILGLTRREIEVLERAAILHDVGKIGIPENIIHKPGTLSNEELTCVRQHPLTGERIVSQLGFMADALPIIRGHHERYDGRGYPDGLEGQSIPIGARIVAVADVYDALTSERPYRQKMDLSQATAELRQHSGTQFDAACVDALVRVLDRSVSDSAPEGQEQGEPRLAAHGVGGTAKEGAGGF